ncbi:MAG: hypothetical protein EOO37_00090 [Cytophagaceae bacterium]|nr:MAG: hypothetical protein EOO37_00090 [Cytophagaceae bacterium]
MKIFFDFLRRLPDVHSLHDRISGAYNIWLTFYELICKLAPRQVVAQFEEVAEVPTYSAPVSPPPAAPVPPDQNAQASGALDESARAQSPAAVALH